MNYDKMTDGELSLEVGKRVIPQCNSYMIVGDKALFDANHKSFCINDWADIGPIAFDNNISIIKVSDCFMDKQGERKYMATWSKYSAHMIVNDIVVCNENPKRAAAICFLEMMESE